MISITTLLYPFILLAQIVPNWKICQNYDHGASYPKKEYTYTINHTDAHIIVKKYNYYKHALRVLPELLIRNR